MKKLGIIKEYRAILDPEKIGSTHCCVHSGISLLQNKRRQLTRLTKGSPEEISKFQEVQKSTLSLVTGIWLIKLRTLSVDAIAEVRG